MVLKLAAHFLDHLARGLGDGLDEHAAEEEGQRRADDGAGQRQGVMMFSTRSVVGSL